MTDEEKTNGKCIDVAKQFDLEKDPIDIAFGGGWRYFCLKENRTDDRKCRRLDGGWFQNLFSKIIFNLLNLKLFKDDILAKWKGDLIKRYVFTLNAE